MPLSPVPFLSEAAVEQALLEQLQGLGYGIERDDAIGPDGARPERESHDEVVLRQRFEDAIARLNPGLPLEARQDAVRRVMQSELPSLLEENRHLHKLMTEGVDVEYYATEGEMRGTLTAGKVTLIDFEHPEQNDWLAVCQFVVINGQNNRRPDVGGVCERLAAGRDRAESAGQRRGASAGRVQPVADLQDPDSGAVQHQRAAGHLGRHCSPGGITLGRP